MAGPNLGSASDFYPLTFTGTWMAKGSFSANYNAFSTLTHASTLTAIRALNQPARGIVGVFSEDNQIGIFGGYFLEEVKSGLLH